MTKGNILQTRDRNKRRSDLPRLALGKKKKKLGSIKFQAQTSVSTSKTPRINNCAVAGRPPAFPRPTRKQGLRTSFVTTTRRNYARANLASPSSSVVPWTFPRNRDLSSGSETQQGGVHRTINDGTGGRHLVAAKLFASPADDEDMELCSTSEESTRIDSSSASEEDTMQAAVIQLPPTILRRPSRVKAERSKSSETKRVSFTNDRARFKAPRIMGGTTRLRPQRVATTKKGYAVHLEEDTRKMWMGSEVGGENLQQESMDESEITFGPNDSLQMPKFARRDDQEVSTYGFSEPQVLDDDLVEEWSLPDEEVSTAIVFSINGKTYLHEPLPPGWSMKVSKARKRPFYVHPDHGMTWHCPVLLQPKSRARVFRRPSSSIENGSRQRQKMQIETPPSLDAGTPHKQKASPNVASMSDLIQAYNHEAKVYYPDSMPIDGYDASVSSQSSLESTGKENQDPLLQNAIAEAQNQKRLGSKETAMREGNSQALATDAREWVTPLRQGISTPNGTPPATKAKVGVILNTAKHASELNTTAMEGRDSESRIGFATSAQRKEHGFSEDDEAAKLDSEASPHLDSNGHDNQDSSPADNKSDSQDRPDDQLPVTSLIRDHPVGSCEREQSDSTLIVGVSAVTTGRTNIAIGGRNMKNSYETPEVCDVRTTMEVATPVKPPKTPATKKYSLQNTPANFAQNDDHLMEPAHDVTRVISFSSGEKRSSSSLSESLSSIDIAAGLDASSSTTSTRDDVAQTLVRMLNSTSFPNKVENMQSSAVETSDLDDPKEDQATANEFHLLLSSRKDEESPPPSSVSTTASLREQARHSTGLIFRRRAKVSSPHTKSSEKTPNLPLRHSDEESPLRSSFSSAILERKHGGNIVSVTFQKPDTGRAGSTLMDPRKSPALASKFSDEDSPLRSSFSTAAPATEHKEKVVGVVFQKSTGSRRRVVTKPFKQTPVRQLPSGHEELFVGDSCDKSFHATLWKGSGDSSLSETPVIESRKDMVVDTNVDHEVSPMASPGVADFKTPKGTSTHDGISLPASPDSIGKPQRRHKQTTQSSDVQPASGSSKRFRGGRVSLSGEFNMVAQHLPPAPNKSFDASSPNYDGFESDAGFSPAFESPGGHNGKVSSPKLSTKSKSRLASSSRVKRRSGRLRSNSMRSRVHIKRNRRITEPFFSMCSLQRLDRIVKRGGKRIWRLRA